MRAYLVKKPWTTPSKTSATISHYPPQGRMTVRCVGSRRRKKGEGGAQKSKRNARVCPAGTQSSCARAATRKVRVRPLAPRARFAAHLPRVRAVAGSQRRLVGHHGNLGLGRDGRRGRRSDARDHRERGQHHGRASHGSLGEVGLCHPEQVLSTRTFTFFFPVACLPPAPRPRVGLVPTQRLLHSEAPPYRSSSGRSHAPCFRLRLLVVCSVSGRYQRPARVGSGLGLAVMCFIISRALQRARRGAGAAGWRVPCTRR